MLPVQQPATNSDDDSEDGDSEYGWEGIPDTVPDPVDHEDEYVDEDKYTTVTVEEVDISRDGMQKLQGNEDGEVMSDTTKEHAVITVPSRDASKKMKERDRKPKKKKKSFRYESPAERKLNRVKERAKKSKAARIRRGE